MMTLLSQGRTRMRRRHHWPDHLVEFPRLFGRRLSRLVARRPCLVVRRLSGLSALVAQWSKRHHLLSSLTIPHPSR